MCVCVCVCVCVCRTDQLHHHVYRTDFVWIDSVDKLANLLKGGPVGGVISTASANQLTA